MIKFLFLFLFLCPLAAFSQTICPENMICLTQQQANIAAQNARELQAQREKVAVLESALKSKDETIAELQKTNQENVSALKEAIARTERELALKTGQLIGAENELN